MLSTALGRLRVISMIEGISFLAILGITMPLKYLADMPGPNQISGMTHGLLFVIFVLALLLCKSEENWSWKKAVLVFLTSLIPFGMLYAEWRIFRK